MENNEKKIVEDVKNIFKVDDADIQKVKDGVEDLIIAVEPIAEEIYKGGITFEAAVKTIDTVIPVIEKVVAPVVESVVEKIEDKKEENKVESVHFARRKAEAIKIGKPITVIYGSLDDQKVLNGRIVSVIDKGITIIDQNENIKDPVVILFDRIIDIYEVKKFRTEKEPFTIFKMNKKIREFFTGDEEELKHAYEQKITVKKLRDELKKKNKENK